MALFVGAVTVAAAQDTTTTTTATTAAGLDNDHGIRRVDDHDRID